MRLNARVLIFLKRGLIYLFSNKQIRRYHRVPFLDLYKTTTGQKISNGFLDSLKKKHPNIDTLSEDKLQCTLQILRKFNITALDACQDPHIFCMNPLTMDNYGEILKECGFVKIIPKYIIRYHTLVRSRTISQLKKEGLIKEDLDLQKTLLDYFIKCPSSQKPLQDFPDSSTSILVVRLYILQKYLNWRLLVTENEFNKYCRNYLPLKHKPMSDIEEALDIAQNEIKLDNNIIKRNGFIISSDPVNTKLILQNINKLAGMDIREVLRNEPAILKNNYNSLIQIRNILEEYEISEEAQRRYLRIFCMCPETVKERLNELRNLKEYLVLSTNPRVLWMIVHKNKMMTRLNNIQVAKKQCYSLNHLVASSKVFNSYINSFGDKVCGRDVAILISSSLCVDQRDTENMADRQKKVKFVLKQLKRHKFWLHSALNVIDDNIKFLKRRFQDQVIYNNCLLLLYPQTEIENYINILLQKRSGVKSTGYQHDDVGVNYNNLIYTALTDDQILSLVLYQIEKKYYFSGDGIWSRYGVKIEAQ